MDRIGLTQQFGERTMKGVDGCKVPTRLSIGYKISRRWRPSLSLRVGQKQKQIQRQRLLGRLQNQKRGQGKCKHDEKRGETSSMGSAGGFILPPYPSHRLSGSTEHQQQQQRRHHNSFSPSPCFIPLFIGRDGIEMLSCTSPFDRRSYTIGCVQEIPWRQFTVACQSGACHPWIIVLLADFRVALLNPISGHNITLPGSPISCSDYDRGPHFVLSLSHSHSHSSTPCYTVFIIFGRFPSKLLFFHKGDLVWTQLNLPWDLNSFNTFKGDLYALRAKEEARYLLAVYTYTTQPTPTIEPFGHHWNQPTPTIEKFRMDTTQLPSPNIREFFVHHLVVSPNGEELLLVLEIIKMGSGCGESNLLTVGFQVFTADLSANMWIRKETLGDHVLIIINKQTLFFSAASVGHGVKGNCIFFSDILETGKNPPKMFDLDSGKVTDYPFSNPFNAGQFMFTPSIC